MDLSGNELSVSISCRRRLRSGDAIVNAITVLLTSAAYGDGLWAGHILSMVRAQDAPRHSENQGGPPLGLASVLSEFWLELGATFLRPTAASYTSLLFQSRKTPSSEPVTVYLQGSSSQ